MFRITVGPVLIIFLLLPLETVPGVRLGLSVLLELLLRL